MTDDDDTTPPTSKPRDTSVRQIRSPARTRYPSLDEQLMATAAAEQARRAAEYSGDPDEAIFDARGDDDNDDDDFGDDGGGALALAPGHFLMDGRAIAAALRASGFDGSFDVLSREEEARARALIQYRDHPGVLYKPHLIADDAVVGRLDALLDQAPNLSALTGLVIRAAHLSRLTGQPLRLPPVLLVGPPGIGKTRYTRRLAEVLGTDIETIIGSNLPDTGSLHGYNTTWRGAKPGRVAKAALSAKTSCLIIFLDECEKINDYERSAHPLDVLLPLLEQHTARAFIDDYLQVPMRLDRLIWIFAANSLDGLSKPFCDRVVTITAPDLTAAQRDDVLQTILAEVAAELGLAMAAADPVVIAPLRSLGPRRARIAAELAFAFAIQHGRALTRDDIVAAVALLDDAAGQRQSVGFLPSSHHHALD